MAKKSAENTDDADLVVDVDLLKAATSMFKELRQQMVAVEAAMDEFQLSLEQKLAHKPKQ